MFDSAHVSVERVGDEVRESRGGQLGERRACGRCTKEYLADDDPEVFASRAKRRQRHDETPEPTEKVLAEHASPNEIAQILVRRRDQPEVDLDRFRRPERCDLLLLQRAENGRLCGEWEITDLVQEKRPAVGGAHEAYVFVLGPGERALPVTKEL